MPKLPLYKSLIQAQQDPGSPVSHKLSQLRMTVASQELDRIIRHGEICMKSDVRSSRHIHMWKSIVNYLKVTLSLDNLQKSTIS
jgi:hypothetical protein